MRLAIVCLAFCLSGCADLMNEPRFVRWAHTSQTEPMISAPLTRAEARGLFSEAVTVYGYTGNVRLHFALKDARFSELLDVVGGLPPFGGRGRDHLGVVRARCDFPGGEGYAFNFKNWRRRDALT